MYAAAENALRSNVTLEPLFSPATNSFMVEAGNSGLRRSPNAVSRVSLACTQPHTPSKEQLTGFPSCGKLPRDIRSRGSGATVIHERDTLPLRFVLDVPSEECMSELFNRTIVGSSRVLSEPVFGILTEHGFGKLWSRDSFLSGFAEA